MKKKTDSVWFMVIYLLFWLFVVIAVVILSADEIAGIFDASFLSAYATGFFCVLALTGVFGALICSFLYFLSSRKDKK